MLVFMDDAAEVIAAADVVDEPVRFDDWYGLEGVGSGACGGAVGAELVVGRLEVTQGVQRAGFTTAGRPRSALALGDTPAPADAGVGRRAASVP
jgi:hypothetical protein